MTYRFVVLSPTLSSNVLGRGLFVADMCARLGPTVVVGVGRGPVWAGAQDFGMAVAPLSGARDACAFLMDQATAGAALGERLVVVAIKPFLRSWGVCAAAKERGADYVFVADADDWDTALSQEFMDTGLPSRARLCLRQNHPRRIERMFRNALPKADVFSFSTYALKDVLPTFAGPALRVPHPRPSVPYRSPEVAVEGRLRLGFLGTARAHKGLDTVVAVLRARPTFQLHVLDGTQLSDLQGVREGQVVRHPHLGAGTLGDAFREVDVVLLPQDTNSAAARYQLPAKMLDAFRHGRCVVASPTEAIAEIGGDVVMLAEPSVEGWLAVLDELAADPELTQLRGQEARNLFEKQWSSEVLAASFAGVLEKMCGSHSS